MKRIHILISGEVTGVFFRAFIKRNAISLKINGFVRNTKDNKVEAILEGLDKNIEKLIELCKKGPEGSEVVDIKIKEETFKNEFKDFEVVY